MKKISIMIIGFWVIIGSSAFGLTLDDGRFNREIQSLRYSDPGRDYSKDVYAQKDDEIKTTQDKNIYQYEYKSPKRAFLYSLIIPGWGQKYAGSTIVKPIMFLAVEGVSWAMYIKYHGDGNKKTDEFEKYADDHWLEYDRDGDLLGAGQNYRGWLLNNGILEDTMTHMLPDTKSQQYYEMIGKYDQFRAGWDDYWDDEALYNTTVSPHREYYNILRGKANDLYDKGKTFVIVAMVNHLLSAFDAALAANRHNRNQSGDNWMSLRVEMQKYSATEEMPILKMAFKF